MPKTPYEMYIRGPWTEDERTTLGKLALRLVTSKTWEYLFLIFIVFMAGIKVTQHREQDQGWVELRLTTIVLSMCYQASDGLLSAEYEDFLLLLSFYGCIIYTAEWLIELGALGTYEFFSSVRPIDITENGPCFLLSTFVVLLNLSGVVQDRHCRQFLQLGFLPCKGI